MIQLEDGCGRLASRSLSLGEETPPSYPLTCRAKMRSFTYS
jgi:hypothetical protein